MKNMNKKYKNNNRDSSKFCVIEIPEGKNDRDVIIKGKFPALN